MTSPTPAVNVIGDLRSAIGLVQASRSVVDAMLSRGIQVSYTELTYDEQPEVHPLDSRYWELSALPVHPVNLLLFNVNEMHKLSASRYSELMGGRYTIAYWWWELPQLPAAFREHVDRVDEIWVSSRYVRDAMLTVTHRPVTVIPLPVELVASAAPQRAHFGLPSDRYIFLFTFTATSCASRKNPWSVIEAFAQAFPKRSSNGPLLVIRAQHLGMFPELREQLVAKIDSVEGVLLEGSYSRAEMNDLLALADAYVSLHRCEGVGLGMAESMYLGKPVIAVNYSGNVDYMDSDNSYLVGYDIRHITADDHRLQPLGCAPYEPGQIWAEPDVSQAARWMAHLYANPEEGRRRGQRGAATIRRLMSTEAAGLAIERRLIEIGAYMNLAKRAPVSGNSGAHEELYPALGSAQQRLSIIEFRLLKRQAEIVRSLAALDQSAVIGDGAPHDSVRTDVDGSGPGREPRRPQARRQQNRE